MASPSATAQTAPGAPPALIPVRTPNFYVPMPVASRTIQCATAAAALACLAAFASSIAAWVHSTRVPLIYEKTTGGRYVRLDPLAQRPTRDDLEVFLAFVIPKLHEVEGAKPKGLDYVANYVSPKILEETRKRVKAKENEYAQAGANRYALVSGINEDTLTIRRDKHYAFVQAVGTVSTVTANGRAITNPIQWDCVIYITSPFEGETTNIFGAGIASNDRGLYLQQIQEKRPGELNRDAPKPTPDDQKERANQERARRAAAPADDGQPNP